MKITAIDGKIRAQTEKAVCINGTWVPRSAIESLETVVGEYDRSGEVEKVRPGLVLAVLKWPIEVGGGASISYGVLTESGRRFWRQGFHGWTEETAPGS